MDSAPESCDKLTAFRLITGFMSENKAIFAVYFATILILPIQDIGLPHFIGKLTSSISAKQPMTYPLSIIIGLVCLIQVGQMFMEYLDTAIFPQFHGYIRDNLLQRLIVQNDSAFQELPIGKIMMRLTRLPASIYAFVTMLKNIFIPNFFIYSFAIVYFMTYDPILGVGLLGLIVGVILSIIYTTNTCSAVSVNRDVALNDMNEQIDDMLRNMISILNNSTDKAEMERVREYQDSFIELTRQSLDCSRRLKFFMVPMVLAFFSFFCYRIYNRMERENMKPAQFIPLLLIFLYIMNSLWSMMGTIGDLVMRMGIIKESINTFDICGKHAIELLRETEEQLTQESTDMPIAPVNALPSPTSEVALRLENLTYRYPNSNKSIFNNFNLSFKAGKRTLILGQIGSGKSSILKLLLKYQLPESGEIYYHGVPYSELTSRQLRQRIAYVPQTAILFDRTLYENITYASPEDRYSKPDVEALFHRTGLADMLHRMPLGLDTRVGKYGSNLSGGQRQIVWILRALLQDTDIVLLDEPTSAIDESTKDIVRNLLKSLMKDKTVILVTHDRELIDLADETIEIHDGHIKIKA